MSLTDRERQDPDAPDADADALNTSAPGADAQETSAEETDPRDTHCPSCGEAVVAGDVFCEACGVRLTPLPVEEPSPEPIATGDPAPGATCVRCGGDIADDGYCLSCGQPAALPRDHMTASPSPWVGGVCDRGVVHARNEDAMALDVVPAGAESAVAGTGILVVCDGVSAAPDSDIASLAAAHAAQASLTAGIQGLGDEDARTALPRLLVAAARAGDAAVRASDESGPEGEPPSCTFVASVVTRDVVATAWVGDSRAYWLPEEGEPVQLTRDHSWAQEMLELGASREEAENAPQAHAITRWLGPDAEDEDADTTVLAPRGPGWVLVCSDGLWNYCSPAGDLAELVRDAVARVGSDPTDIAGELVRWACEQGGRDNVTVALASVAATSLKD